MSGGAGGGLGRWWGRVGSQRRVKPSIRTHTDSSAVCAVGNTNSLNLQDRPRQSLATVWHHTHPY